MGTTKKKTTASEPKDNRASAKTTTITLVVPDLGMSQEFALGEAETLLGMPNNGGWRLPEDSPFEFDGYAIKRRKA